MASNLEFQGRSVTAGLQEHSSDPSTTSILERRSGECLPASLRKSLRHAKHSGESLIESSGSESFPATCPRLGEQKKKRQFTRERITSQEVLCCIQTEVSDREVCVDDIGPF